MILDGRAIAEDIYTDLAPQFAALRRGVSLGILVVGVNPVIEQFVRIKARAAERLGIETVRVDLPESATTEEVIVAVRDMREKTDALIVQLPMPKQVDTNGVLAEIPHDKDVDVINPGGGENPGGIEAPVALAVIELLKRGGVEIAGKRAVVIGAGRLVGAPSLHLLKKCGADATFFTLQEGSIEDLKTADIIVCGAGNPGFVKPEHVREGVAIIDAGASEQAGVIRGDADPAIADKASVFSPVPGGVGPVAVAMIFKNLLALVSLRS
jgi:methylenetetrahydrofolate dehydrogenase (NADP+)/methenyltetrahydrofolate cyclohydrolase